MGISPLLRPLGITAAIFGVGQAVAWCVLTLLGILIYTGLWAPTFYATNFPERLGFMIALIFAQSISDSQEYADPRIINNRVFFGFVCTYFILSFIWIVSSLCMFWVTFRKKIRNYKTIILVWVALTCLISILDIILTSLLIADYDYLYHTFTAPSSDLTVVATGVMMTIAARGFGFLLINIILLCTLAILAWRITEQDINKSVSQQQIINGYQTGNNTWLAGAGDPRVQSQGGQSNPAFDSSFDKQSPRDGNNVFNFTQPPPQPISNHQPQTFTYLQNPPQNFVLPKLSKTPTGPYIPAPDYTPPTSPLQKFPKSVLKNRSHYAQ